MTRQHIRYADDNDALQRLINALKDEESFKQYLMSAQFDTDWVYKRKNEGNIDYVHKQVKEILDKANNVTLVKRELNYFDQLTTSSVSHA